MEHCYYTKFRCFSTKQTVLHNRSELEKKNDTPAPETLVFATINMGMKRHKRQYVVLKKKKKKVIKPQYVAAPRANDSHPMLRSDSGRQLTLGSLTTTTPTHNSPHCQHCLCKTTPNQYTSIPLVEEIK